MDFSNSYSQINAFFVCACQSALTLTQLELADFRHKQDLDPKASTWVAFKAALYGLYLNVPITIQFLDQLIINQDGIISERAELASSLLKQVKPQLQKAVSVFGQYNYHLETLDEKWPPISKQLADILDNMKIIQDQMDKNAKAGPKDPRP